MKRTETIKNQNLFNEIIKTGSFKKNKYFVIYNKPNINTNKMYGIAVSKKFGKAVQRNKIKRQTRAIIDTNQKLFKNGYNYIIMIRKSCKDEKYSILEEALLNLLEN